MGPIRLSAQPIELLHTFSAAAGITNLEGLQPRADLVLWDNTLYGTTPLGGANGYGTVFSLNTDGTGFTVLHSFKGDVDGTVPNKDLVLYGNKLYGTVGRGTNGGGYGSVFSLDTNGSNFTLIYTFNSNATGALGEPNAGLLLSGETLYGAAYQGGISNAGSIFSVDTNGSFNLLHLFDPGTEGANPLGTLVLSSGMLYGTTRNGGTNGLYGTVFSMGTDGNNFKVLHTFSGAPTLDGRNPNAGLILSGNTLYGTTGFGGTSGGGTVFSISTDGSSYTVIHSFNSPVGEGKIPEAALALQGGMLYGTTLGGSSSLSGTVFSVNTNGSSFSILHTFSVAAATYGYTNSDGAQPYGSLAIAGDVLYGTTSAGGPTGMGTVFRLIVAPEITNLHLDGANLVLKAINGVAGCTYTVLTSTDLISPLYKWTPITTNYLSVGGDFTITANNAVNANSGQRFYSLLAQ